MWNQDVGRTPRARGRRRSQSSPSPPASLSLATTYQDCRRIARAELPRLTIADQLLQFLQQLHHRPRIPFTIVEQVLPHPIVLVPRNLPGHEEQPSDLHARDAAVHDHEVVVGQLRDERREDLLEAVDAVEASPDVIERTEGRRSAVNLTAKRLERSNNIRT